MAQEFADGQTGSNKFKWKSSAYRFTDPVRKFKSNDPYYWEVDNIHVKQLEENILWLRDQVAFDQSLSGVNRSDFNELRPFVNLGSRVVSVLPGRYTGRVNDAYKKGISTISKLVEASLLNQNVKSQITFNLPDSVLSTIVGSVVTNIFSNNGLYDHLQHHSVSFSKSDGSVDSQNSSGDFIQNFLDGQGVHDLPKVKLALWKQASTAKTFDPVGLDLAQLAVEFTRRWGGVSRTSIVNIPSTLTISIPDFADNDYVNNSNFTPSVRIDMVFIYTHPIDASSTTIPKPNGQLPTTITAPQLGIVKGAGVIAVNGQGPTFSNLDLKANPGLINSDAYLDNKDNPDNYFTAGSGVDSEGRVQIQSVIADQTQTVLGMNGVFGAFPSPDDLMNLAPLLAEGLESDNFSLIGQSILPVAYIFVKKGEVTLTDADLVDIRPLLRTTELAYNERAGISAAFPPLSLANPAVGKSELHRGLKQTRDKVLGDIPPPPEYPRPVAAGIIQGGLLYGTEGVLARLAASVKSPDQIIPTDSVALLNWMKTYAGYPEGAIEVPALPDWDLSHWVSNFGAPGAHRNDRINYIIQRSNKNNYAFAVDEIYEGVVWEILDHTLSHGTNDPNSVPGNSHGQLMYFIKKRINIDKTLVPWMNYYDVRCDFSNCIPATNQDVYVSVNHGDQDLWKQYSGLYVEKYKDHFNILCAWPAKDPWNKYGEVGPSKEPSLARDSDKFSSFMVTHDNLFFEQKQTGPSDFMATLPPLMCTYPTISFTVVGYPAAFIVNTNLNTNNPTIQLQSSK